MLAGSFDIGAFVTNPVITTPPFITLPSNFTIHRQQVTLYYTPTNTNQTVNNTGNNVGDGQITYEVTHEGAAAYQLPTKDGWGREPLTPFDNTVLDITASVRVSPEYVTLLPGDRKSVTVSGKLANYVFITYQYLILQVHLMFSVAAETMQSLLRGCWHDAACVHSQNPN